MILSVNSKYNKIKKDLSQFLPNGLHTPVESITSRDEILSPAIFPRIHTDCSKI